LRTISEQAIAIVINNGLIQKLKSNKQLKSFVKSVNRSNFALKSESESIFDKIAPFDLTGEYIETRGLQPQPRKEVLSKPIELGSVDIEFD